MVKRGQLPPPFLMYPETIICPPRPVADPGGAGGARFPDVMVDLWLGPLALVRVTTKAIFCNWFLIVEFFINF